MQRTCIRKTPQNNFFSGMPHLLVPHLLKTKPYDNNPVSQKTLFTSAINFGLELSFLSIYLPLFTSFHFPKVMILLSSTGWNAHFTACNTVTTENTRIWATRVIRRLIEWNELGSSSQWAYVCASGKSKSSHQEVQDAVAQWKTADRERKNTNR